MVALSGGGAGTLLAPVIGEIYLEDLKEAFGA